MSSPHEDTSLKFLPPRTHSRTQALKYLWVVYAPAHYQIHLFLQEVNRVRECNDCADKHFHNPQNVPGKRRMTAYDVLKEEMCSRLHTVSSGSHKPAAELVNLVPAGTRSPPRETGVLLNVEL